METARPSANVPVFDRSFFGSVETVSRIGGGALGGKAEGLLRTAEAVGTGWSAAPLAGTDVSIPRMAVLATDAFDAFLERNALGDVLAPGVPDHRIAHAFLRAHLPAEVVGDLRALVEEAHVPLAVRSSSLLEDALERPFAGVYETKMIPNNQPDSGARFQKLSEAIKLVYASTFFRRARAYRKVTGAHEGAEKMAVILQEVVGDRHGDRFYPELSAVVRSFSYYPIGGARPEDGVASLALGLGKTIVDGGLCWSYSPRRPAAPPPFGSVRRMLRETQTRFWCVNMGSPPAYDPIAETEYMTEADLDAAEYDGTLQLLASTYDAESDRLRPGTGRPGPRVLDFAPLRASREGWSERLAALLELGESAFGGAVEIEIAAVLASRTRIRPRVGLVQVRPMQAPGAEVGVRREDLDEAGLLLASSRAMGNGVLTTIRDVVYTPRGRFQAGATRLIAGELSRLNRRLVDEGRPYLLIGFGRWGTADPWLGIPVDWSQVSGAAAFVEAATPGMDVEPSQGSHFFHNLSSLDIPYLAVGLEGGCSRIDWSRLDAEPALTETHFLRHVRFERPLELRVDGRSGRGLARVPPAGAGASEAPGSHA